MHTKDGFWGYGGEEGGGGGKNTEESNLGWPIPASVVPTPKLKGMQHLSQAKTF